ncbi:hypothetical protein F3D3_4312 [Fusibacter sp. 3D3]|nr:hypothetical protein F3D3_4312 [Fusibacter sp. 3D3]
MLLLGAMDIRDAIEDREIIQFIKNFMTSPFGVKYGELHHKAL